LTFVIICDTKLQPFVKATLEHDLEPVRQWQPPGTGGGRHDTPMKLPQPVSRKDAKTAKNRNNSLAQRRKGRQRTAKAGNCKTKPMPRNPL
jgi:hypothetical protein